MLRRSEKKIKDANLQAEEERRTADQYKEQVEKLNTRLRTSKRAADEAEEETTRVNGLKRKLQRDLDEANEQIEALQRELQNQRNKARREGGLPDRPSTAASSEVSRMSSRNRYQTDLYAEDDQWSDSSSLKGSQTSLNYTSKE